MTVCDVSFGIDENGRVHSIVILFQYLQAMMACPAWMSMGEQTSCVIIQNADYSGEEPVVMMMWYDGMGHNCQVGQNKQKYCASFSHAFSKSAANIYVFEIW
ncbi:MAG: hypothetical protein LUC24_03220 [Bacteroidales bacterium]|nr:hypothetical protein [Bacteroidales bacterium]